MVVEDEDDGVESGATDGGELGAGHLKGAVADEDDGTQAGACHLGAKGGGDAEAHGSIVGGGEEFGSPMDDEVNGAEEAGADVADDDHVVAQQIVQPAEEVVQRHERGSFPCGDRLGWMGDGEVAGFDLRAQERLHEVPEMDSAVAVAADLDFFRGGLDASGAFQLGGVDAEVHVGEEGAEHKEAVGLLHEFLNLGAAHGAFVNSQIAGMFFADDGFSENGGGDRDARLIDKFFEFRTESVAVDFHVGEDHGLFGAIEPLGDFRDGFAERVAIACFARFGPGRGVTGFDVNHVARKLDVDGALEFPASGEGFVDLPKCRVRVVENDGGGREFFKDLLLSGEIAHLVVEHRIIDAFPKAGGAGEHDDGGFFRVGTGDGVGDVESADAVGDAYGANAVHAGVGVRGIAGAVLACHPDHLDRALFEHFIKSEHVVAGDAEDVTDTVGLKSLDEVLADGHGRMGLGQNSGDGGQNQERRLVFDRSGSPPYWFMKIFITGGTGYIGSRLIPRLLQRGHSVQTLVRRGSESRLPSGCTAVVGDALDRTTFAGFVSGVDVFIQLLGVPHPSPSKAEQFRAVDLVSVRESVAVAAGTGVRHFIYVSVAHPASIMKAYIDVRKEGERMIREAGLNATILRPWYVLGPRRWWPKLILPLYWILERIPSTRASALRLGFVSIDQMVSAMIQAVEQPSQGVTVLEVPRIREMGSLRI